MERFEKYTTPEPNTGCLLWAGRLDRDGYARFKVKQHLVVVPRWIYEQRHGPIEDKKIFVCHTCDNRWCCEDRHHFLGTHRKNMDDMMSKGRSPMGERNPNAKLTKEQVIEIFNEQGYHRVIAERYGIPRSSVTGIKNGRSWQHLNLRKP